MSKIQWTDETWNPIHLVKEDGSHGGHWCKKVSPGCANCYSEAQNNSGFFAFASHLKYTGQKPCNLILDDEVLKQPLRWRKPRKIFVCSMTDLFGEWVGFDWVDCVLAIAALCPQHTFQILTKRPERMLDYFNQFLDNSTHLSFLGQWASDMAFVSCDKGWREFHSFIEDDDEYNTDHVYEELRDAWSEGFLPNVWLGTSVENQEMANERIPYLLNTPASVRFLSVEPLLGEIDLTDIVFGLPNQRGGEVHTNSLSLDGLAPEDDEEFGGNLINWVIVGGESGKGSRLCQAEWIQSIVEQCQESNVPVFVKQLGAKPILPTGYSLRDRKGGDIEEFPDNLRIREFPVA